MSNLCKLKRRSKTLWFNAVCAGLVALESQAHVLQPYLPANVYAIATTVLIVGNVVLRFFTASGISLK